MEHVLPTAVNAAFPLLGRSRAWRVESGSVDVFLELPSLSNADGPRKHLFRVFEGEVLFGVAEAQPCPVLALPAPGSRIAEANRATAGIPALERWIEGVTAAIAADVPPRRYESLEPGVETETGARPVSPGSGVVWASVVEGTAQFLADPDLDPLQPGDAIPLTPGSWLEPLGSARFAGHATADFSVSVWHALDGFHARALLRLQQIAAREEAVEREQSKKRSRSDSARMDHALRELATPLVPGARIGGSATGDPWLAVCRAIGPLIGVEFTAPPDRSSAAALDDPLRAIAEVSRTRCRQVVLAGNWWKGQHGPLAGQRESDRSPVALLPSRRGYVCFDPATGARQRVTAELAAALEAFAWSFYPPFPLEKVGLGQLLRFGLRGAKPEMLLILLAGLGAAAIAMAMPVATGYAFDKLIPDARRGVLTTLAVVLFVAAICGSLFELLRGVVMLRIEGKMDTAIQAAVWDRLLELPPAFFRQYSAGDLATRGLGIQTIREVLTGSVAASLLSGIFSLSSFALLFWYSTRLALVAGGLTLFAFLFVAAAGYAQTVHQRRLSELKGKLSGLLLQMVGGINKIRVSAAEARAFHAWAIRFAEIKTVSVRSRRVTNRISVFNSVWPVLCSLAVFAFYSGMLKDAAAAAGTPGAAAAGAMSTGDFVAFLAAFTQLLQGAIGLASAMNAMVAIAPAYESATPILDAIPESAGARSQPGELRGAIEVRHVSYRYGEDSPLILKDVSLSIEPGQFAAIVGSSGSGKSTLLRLLLGFETPETGSVYYDRHDLAHLDVRAVRRQIGVVLQNGRIRAGSIFANIVGVSSKLTLDDAWEAARMAGFDADLEAMPMGMQTVLGEGGGTLSGGQRQRLLIARALVRRPRIVFFDEATSALDNQTQAIVSRSLDRLRATRVVIAHRLSTVERADCIYVLERGRLVEQGSYAELMDRGERFAELARRQIT